MTEQGKPAPQGEMERKRRIRKSKAKYAWDVLRVTPESQKPVKNKKSDRLTDLLAALFIFGIALWVRFWIRNAFYNAYPAPGFNLLIADGDPLGIGKFFGLKSGQTLNSEGYVDYTYYYIPYVQAYTDKHWNPYAGNLADGDVLNAYVYGPWYIYFISFGRMFFHLSVTDSIIWSNVVFDSLCYVMVYLLAKRVTGNVIAMFAAVLGSFSPIALYYANIIVLNAPSMTFFTLVFIYFFLEHRDRTAAFFLVFALLNKQFPLFLAMPFGFWLVRRNGFLKGVIIFLNGFVYAILLSIPWILMTPQAYIRQLFLAGGGKTFLSCPEGGEAPNLVAGEMDPGACASSHTVAITPFGKFLFFYINHHYIFFGSLFILAWVGFTAYDKMEKDPKLYYKFFAAYFALAHATIARGIYKYYLTFMIPLIILALIPGDKDHSFNIRIGRLLHNGWSKWIDPENRNRPASISYWLLFFVLLLGTISIFVIIELGVSLFAVGNYHRVWTVGLSIIALVLIIFPGGSAELEKPKLMEYNTKSSVFLIMIFIFGYLLKQVFTTYFNHNKSQLNKYTNIIIALVALYFIIPYLLAYVSGEKTIDSHFTLEYGQLILDIFGLYLYYKVLLLFNLQIMLADRFYTTTIMLTYGIFFMALLGEEVWSTFVSVPRNAITRFIKLWERYEKEKLVSIPT